MGGALYSACIWLAAPVAGIQAHTGCLLVWLQGRAQQPDRAENQCAMSECAKRMWALPRGEMAIVALGAQSFMEAAVMRNGAHAGY